MRASHDVHMAKLLVSEPKKGLPLSINQLVILSSNASNASWHSSCERVPEYNAIPRLDDAVCVMCFAYGAKVIMSAILIP